MMQKYVIVNSLLLTVAFMYYDIYTRPNNANIYTKHYITVIQKSSKKHPFLLR